MNRHRDFRARVEAALALIPLEFRDLLGDTPILVEDWPSEALLTELGMEPEDALYGLYEGPDRFEAIEAAREGFVGLPGRVILYQGPLEEDFAGPEELQREVAITLVHEIAHHFGIDEARLEELGWD